MVAEDLEFTDELVRLPLEEEGVQVCLLDLSRLAGTDAARFLTPKEREEYGKLRHPGRRCEWLGARVCLKAMLLGRGSISDPLQCRIVKDRRGRPRLSFKPGFPLSDVVDCSLSHKARFACACASGRAETRVGIDVEIVSPRLAKLERVFVNDRDWLVRTHSPQVRLAVLWALKEACSKALGLGVGLGLADVICEETAEGRHNLWIDNGPEFSARHFVHEGYVIALCMMPEAACVTVT